MIPLTTLSKYFAQRPHVNISVQAWNDLHMMALEDEVREIVEMCKEGLEQWNGHLERATLDAIQKRAYVRRGRKLTITLPECWRGMKSRAYLQWKSCRSKMRYSTRHEAESAAERQGKEHGIIFRVYPCNLCHGYHMTHAKERSGYAAD